MADFWKPTADLYSALFEKPKMSQKLLEKPPFKYIFDIIMETTKQTGYAKGLYTGDELDGNTYDNKDKKLSFLQKIIDLTSMMLKEEIAAKPGKIAAGLEPENTNLLLQAIYRAAVSGKNSDPFVKKILGGPGAKEPEPPKKEQPKPEQKPQQPPPKEQAPPQVKEEKKVAPPKEEQKPKQQAQQPPPQQPKETQKQQQQPPPQQQQTQEGNVRPSTAKKRPPQLPTNQVAVEQNQKKGGTANVIIEGKGNNDDDDGVIVQSNVKPNADINAQEYGKFVRDNMKNQDKAKEEEKEKDQPQEGIKMKRIGKVNVQKDKIKEEIAQNLGTSQVSDTIVMQKLIQSMSQNVNPLAKQIEFIQDDIENMNRELQQWRKIYNVSKQKMVDMNRATEEAQQPLFDKIAEVEEVIKEKKSKIQNIKAQIIKNKLQIDQLLKAVLVQK
ncbi:unnamed protein product (macronuclear) [Paramecium tetraurelia]|uniref:TRAF3-interacting protein 1 n=1 Tax=Paramecium tetraurelia TaxID=5888 RepID=A0BWC2_PARTE|nr:uncharacterized protein GSPATT00032691001 [Paramecium tetraurelia]CAK62839.1 unnamed protein product [Paramecium tetraurelia]|eukprot:XP_001430237.1 hypothetical protein (macronuclear) [Paramecium tetraurelia strain d4-2]